jgi:FtsH-binding integral membrane protein
MVHLGIDIDEFILLTIYPAAAFFAIGYVARKTKMQAAKSYFLQGITCIAFSIAYIFVPNGGAQGLAIVLGMFGVLLLFIARKQKIEQPQQNA